MRRLILLRHAKAAWDDPTQADHDRPLNKRGRRACAAIGGWLADKGYVPNQVLCSSSARTTETWARLSGFLPDAPTATALPALYLADVAVLSDTLRAATGQVVAMVGHNPGMAEFAHQLPASLPDHPALGRFPTLATMVVDFDLDDWAGIVPGAGILRDFAVPRDFADGS
ncbi:MAG: SixA phosphatase family protein [Qingshengfaniella sp.]